MYTIFKVFILVKSKQMLEMFMQIIQKLFLYFIIPPQNKCFWGYTGMALSGGLLVNVVTMMVFNTPDELLILSI